MKPCPFCGHAVDFKNPDTLYPNGRGWKIQPNGMKTYNYFLDVPKEQWCWSMHCASGCGIELPADSEQEAVDKWNTRV